MPTERRAGLHDVEILVVLLIVAFSSAIAIPLFLNQRDKAQDAEAKSAVTVAASAIVVFHQDHDTFTGADVAALVQIEPSLAEASGLDVAAAADDGYTLSVDSASGGQFTRRAHAHQHRRTCDPPARACRTRATPRSPTATLPGRVAPTSTRRDTAGHAGHGPTIRVARREHCHAMGRPPPALRGHRRRGHERPRARRARARRERHRLRPRGRLAVRGAAARGRDRARRSATTPPTSPTAPRSSYSSAIPPDNPERAARARARAAPRRPARRAHAAASRRSRLRHPRQDDDVEHGRPRAARRGLDPSYLVGGEVRSHRLQRRLGDGGVAGGRGRRVRPLAAQARARGSRCSPTPSSTTTRPTPRSATSTTTFRAFLALGRARGGLGPAGPARARRRHAGRRSTSSPSCAERLALRASTASPSTLPVPGAHNARNAAAALTACRLAGADVARRRGGAGRLRRRRPALRAPRHHAPRARSSSTTTPTTRPRSRATIEAARTLDAAPASSPSSSRTSSRARSTRRASSAPRSRSPTSSSCSTSTRRASAPRTSRASPAGSSPRRPPTRRGGKRVAWLPDFDAAEALPARRAARGRPAADARRGRRRRARAGACR